MGELLWRPCAGCGDLTWPCRLQQKPGPRRLLLNLLPILTTWMLLSAPGVAASSVDMCSGDTETSTEGTLHGPASPDHPDHAQCSCNLTAPTSGRPVLLSLTLSLRSELLDCDPVLLLLPYQVCPTADGEDMSLNVLVEAGEKITLTLNNPHHLTHTTLVYFSAQTPFTVTCGPTLVPGLPPIARPSYVIPPSRDVGSVRDVSMTPAIIASIVIIVAALSLVVAAIIRWRCVMIQHKQKGLGTTRGHLDESRGDNPAYLHTPKTSVIDVRRAASFSSLSGVGRENGQPRQAPISGVGALAAHSEPQHPVMTVNGGMPGMGNGTSKGMPYRYLPPSYPPPTGCTHAGYPTQANRAPNPAVAPPQPRRPAPSRSVPYGHGDEGQPQYAQPYDSQPRYSQPYDSQPRYSQPQNARQPERIRPEGDQPQYGQPGPQGRRPPRDGPPDRPQYSHPPTETDSPQGALPVGPRAREGAPPGGVPHQGAPLEGPPLHPRAAQLRDAARPPTPDVSRAFNFSADDLPFMDDVSDDDVIYVQDGVTSQSASSSAPRGSTQVGGPEEDVYSCAHCDHTEARYGRIMCHLVKEHPNCRMDFRVGRQGGGGDVGEGGRGGGEETGRGGVSRTKSGGGGNRGEGGGGGGEGASDGVGRGDGGIDGVRGGKEPPVATLQEGACIGPGKVVGAGDQSAGATHRATGATGRPTHTYPTLTPVTRAGAAPPRGVLYLINFYEGHPPTERDGDMSKKATLNSVTKQREGEEENAAADNVEDRNGVDWNTGGDTRRHGGQDRGRERGSGREGVDENQNVTREDVCRGKFRDIDATPDRSRNSVDAMDKGVEPGVKLAKNTGVNLETRTGNKCAGRNHPLATHTDGYISFPPDSTHPQIGIIGDELTSDSSLYVSVPRAPSSRHTPAVSPEDDAVHDAASPVLNTECADPDRCSDRDPSSGEVSSSRGQPPAPPSSPGRHQSACRWLGRSVSYTSDIPLAIY